MAVVTALATRLHCDRVSVGFVQHGHARVMAVSHSAEFKEQPNVIQGMADAMDEAIDQRETIVYPPHGGWSLGRRAGARAILQRIWRRRDAYGAAGIRRATRRGVAIGTSGHAAL